MPCLETCATSLCEGSHVPVRWKKSRPRSETSHAMVHTHQCGGKNTASQWNISHNGSRVPVRKKIQTRRETSQTMAHTYQCGGKNYTLAVKRLKRWFTRTKHNNLAVKHLKRWFTRINAVEKTRPRHETSHTMVHTYQCGGKNYNFAVKLLEQWFTVFTRTRNHNHAGKFHKQWFTRINAVEKNNKLAVKLLRIS